MYEVVESVRYPSAKHTNTSAAGNSTESVLTEPTSEAYVDTRKKPLPQDGQPGPVEFMHQATSFMEQATGHIGQIEKQSPEAQRQFGTATCSNFNGSLNSAMSPYPTSYYQFKHILSPHMTQQPFKPPRFNSQWATIPPLQQYPPPSQPSTKLKRKRRRFVNNWYQYRSIPKRLKKERCEKESPGLCIKRSRSTSPNIFSLKTEQDLHPEVNLDQSAKPEGRCADVSSIEIDLEEKTEQDFHPEVHLDQSAKPEGWFADVSSIEVDPGDKLLTRLDAPVQEICDILRHLGSNGDTKKHKFIGEGSDTEMGSLSKKR
ncbi:hypothetical protein BJ875DRAFT_542113 [Amylocarpus encephaloides]|uniref:Uncharacterized protein n=1 Tax=Amylocarpus encephaloides TaxID=45428 RepID=A0A9P8C6M7_9HELO|nr:hypothetical protein BJ875DRAFT_542113 [Amylocarpus encephaloides]